MLFLDNTSLTLGERHWNFNIALQTHGVYALLGRSGSGKSTLLNLIGGFVQPDSGDIQWQQQSLLTLQPAQRPATTLFQHDNLFDHLSIWKNVALGIAPTLKLSTSQRQQLANVLEDVGLAGYEHKLPNQLSGGEKQRAALARCLLRRKPILLLDEPFSALDNTTRAEMISLLGVLIDSYQPCVIMITHEPDDAYALNAGILDMHADTVSLREATPIS